MMDLNLGRDESRFHLVSHPNEIELYLSNGSSIYMHIGDTMLKTLYNQFINTSDSKMVVRNQYADTFVINGMLRKNGNIKDLQVVLKAHCIMGFMHYGRPIAYTNVTYRTVELIMAHTMPMIQIGFENYEILRNHFCGLPNPHDDDPPQPQAFPVWNANRVPPRKEDGKPLNIRNQWENCFVFDCVTTDLRVARLVTFTDNVLGYINHSYKLD